MSDKISIALAQLEVSNDEHWTEDGLPRMDVVKRLVGDGSLTREAVTAAAPGFTRASAAAPVASAPAPQVQPPWAAPVASAPAEQPPVAEAKELSNASDSGSVGAGPSDDEDESFEAETGIEVRLRRARARLVEAQARKKEADQDCAQANAEVDAVVREMEKEAGSVTLTSNLQHYFATQQRIREERGRRLQELKGIPLKDILPAKAPIDASMARRNQRGMQRPKFFPEKK